LALEPTPIPPEDVIAKGHRTVWYTWFETLHRYSTLSCLFEVRIDLCTRRLSSGLLEGQGSSWCACLNTMCLSFLDYLLTGKVFFLM
jgi:hypothetical protein